MSVPRLLALLAASLEQATSTRGADRNGGNSSWGDGDIAATQALDFRNQSLVAETDSSSDLRIRSLRRAYNILLFGGPSHAEIIAQAALEDKNDTTSNGAATDWWGGLATTGHNNSGGTSSYDDALASVSASVSAVSLELRRSRRFDPANALEGLIEDLLEGQTEGVGDALSVARVLKLLMALRGEGGQALDADDWELVGGHGRRVLERLYNSSGENTQRPDQQQQQRKNATTASLPVAVFFRGGQRVSDGPLRPSCQIPEAGSTLPPKVPQLPPVDSVATAPALQRRRRQQQQQQRYILPNDCVLHGDSTATATAPCFIPSSTTTAHSGLGTMERMPWFTDAEFASERGIPDMTKGSSLDECLEAMATAPLSPAGWTRPYDSKAIPPLFAAARGSGGPPAAPAAAAVGMGKGSRRDRSEAAAKLAARHDERSGAPGVCGGLDLCGALSQARVDTRSPAVRELRLTLSFPDIVEGHPTDLLEAAQQHQPARLTDRPVEVPLAIAVQQSRRRSPRFSREKHASGSWPINVLEPPSGGHTGDFLKGVAAHSCSTRESAAALALEPVGWERTEADWNDPSFPKWALACAPLATAEGGGSGSDKAFELCYRKHFGGVGLGGYSEEPPAAATEAEMVRRALTVLQGVPSDNFWYDEKHARMRVSGLRDDEAARPGGEKGTEKEAALSALPRRVPGLSHGTLLSLLKEFAKAGTWYRRVEEFASSLVDRSSKLGQVAHAFGVELRRQLTVIQSALLGVTTEFSGLGWKGDPDPSCGSVRDAPRASRCCSLTGVLVRTLQLRRAAGALAEICGLMEEDLGISGGVRGVLTAFPRGASLLTYLYNAAEVRVASKPGEGGGREEGADTTVGVVMDDKDSALALLSCSAAPYLTMLGRWLWSGELRAEEDPYEEFPLRCRERLEDSACTVVDGRSGDPGDPRAVKESWMEDGGGSFMTLAFSENVGAGVPCFLEGGVLAAAGRAGKLLRMLKLASPEFYAACSASPPPPLSLVFEAGALASRIAVFERLNLLRLAAGRSAARESRARAAEKEVRKGMASGAGGERLLAGEEKALGKLELQRERDRASVKEARRFWVKGLEGDRAAAAAAAAANATAAAAAAAEKPSFAAVSSGGGGRGGLSFLDPPTSEAEAFAAAAITERYRLLGEEADARAARARWKRKRSARAVAARASLKMLYAEEAHLWKGMAAEAWRTVGSGSGGTTMGTEVAVDGNADSVIIPVDVKTTSVVSSGGDSDGSGSDGGDERNGHVAEEAIAQRVGDVDGDDEDGVELEAELAAGDAIVTGGPVAPDPSDKQHHEDVKFSPVNIVDEPGGKSVGVSAALGIPTDDARGVKFSPVNIVQEPGGKSCGVSSALGGASGSGDDDATTAGSLPELSDAGRIMQAPRGVSNALSSVTSHDSSVAVGGMSGAAREEEHQAHDHGSNVECLPRTAAIGSGESSLGVSLRAVQGATVSASAGGGDAECRSRSGKALQDAPSSGCWTEPTEIAAAEERPEATGDGSSGVARDREVSRSTRRNGEIFFVEPNENRGVVGRVAGTDASLPLEVIVRRCVREPVLTQCSAVDSAALAFLVRDAGVAEHLASLRTFLLGLSSDFLHDFTLRLLDGLYDGGVDWRRSSNLEAAFAASASATGLDSLPLAQTFRYEVDPTCGGLLGPRSAKEFTGIGSREAYSGGGGGGVAAAHSSSATITDARVSMLSSLPNEEEDLYSPVALSFVSPVLEVKWPVGVLLPTGVLHTYGGIHRSLFRHQLALHRLRRLRVALRELDACVDSSSGGGGGRGGPPTMGRRLRRGGGDGGSSRSSSDRRRAAGVSWDRGRLHWLHLFRHEMQHMADSLQTFFAEQAEAGWPDLRRSLAAAGGGGGGSLRGGRSGGGLAALVAAHSCYISRMHRHMFLGNDRLGAVARGRIGEFYEVLCTVGRITDGLLLVHSSSSRKPCSPLSPSPSSSSAPAAAATGDDGVYSSNPGEEAMEMDLRSDSSGGWDMVLPDQAFAELAAARERFDAARRGLCGALSEICAAGGGSRARPLLATLGYGGCIPL